MRHYPTDSPEALTRVVALALLADGAVDPGELDVFKNSPCCFRMGIDPCRFEQIVDEFCDDLLVCGIRKASGRYDLTEDCIRNGIAGHRRFEDQNTVIIGIRHEQITSSVKSHTERPIHPPRVYPIIIHRAGNKIGLAIDMIGD